MGVQPSEPISPFPSGAESVEEKRHPDSEEIQVVIVPGKVTPTRQVIDCIKKELSNVGPSVRLMAEDDFREILFPWFEPSVAPDTPEEMVSLLSRPLVRQRIKDQQIRYLISVAGGTEDDLSKGAVLCFGLPPPGPFFGCYGLQTQERESNLWATVWDLRMAEVANAPEASAKGTSFMAGLVLPFWHTAKPDATACEMLADDLVAILQGRDPFGHPAFLGLSP